jgi:hypothetical protein
MYHGDKGCVIHCESSESLFKAQIATAVPNEKRESI